MKRKEEKIAEKAYLKYVERGCLDGFDQQDWLEAEQEIAKPKKKTTAKAPSVKKPRGKK